VDVVYRRFAYLQHLDGVLQRGSGIIHLVDDEHPAAAHQRAEGVRSLVEPLFEQNLGVGRFGGVVVQLGFRVRGLP